MFRLWLIIGVLVAVFYIYSIVNASLSDRLGVRGLPKAAWIAVVIVFPIIGALLWFWVGRGDARHSHVIAPDDDADFLASLGDHKKPGDGPNA